MDIFLKSKDELFEKLKEFKDIVENISKKKIKTLRLGNRWEFTLDAFKTFYIEVGIKKEMCTH